MHPVIIDLPFFKLQSYGLFMALAFGLAIYYCYKNVEKSGLNMSQDQLLSIATFVILFSMLGARIFYVVQFWPDFQGDWFRILMIKQREGFVFFGGLIGGISYLAWYCRQYKIDFFKFMDFVMPAGALGYAVGRLGCFLNGCCYGEITGVPWAVIFPYNPGELRHPTQIYEVLFGLGLFFLLRYWAKQKKIFVGQIALIGLIAYSLERFLVELIRINPKYGPFTQAQWIAVLLFSIALYIWSKLSKKQH